MQHPETIRVYRDGVEVTINKSDFNPEIEEPVDAEKAPEHKVEKVFADMNATELRAYAKEHGIDVKGLKSKEDLLAAVESAPDELFVFPNADGKFEIIDKDGKNVTGEVYETQEQAEKILSGV